MVSDIELAYIAGLLDGEGSFESITGGGKIGNHHARIRMSNTNFEAVKRLHALFGGSLYHVNSQNPNAREQLTWDLGGHRAAELSELLMPYLRIKHRQAEILVELSKLNYIRQLNKDGWPVRIVSDETRLLREPLIAELRVLNHRGATSVTDNTRGIETL